MNKVLALAVHPDDETLGCGGTLLKHKANGDAIYWLIATNAEEKHGFSKDEVQGRKEEVEQVGKMYGFDGIYSLKIPTTKVDELPRNEVIKKISDVFDKVKPNIVYLPFKSDVHSDHKIIFDAAYSCLKIFRSPFVKKILMMETISETEYAPALKEFTFAPNYFVDITDFVDKKLDIMKVFKSEIGAHPFPRSLENIKTLATFRGLMSGCKYAESFMVLKEIR